MEDILGSFDDIRHDAVDILEREICIVCIAFDI